MEHWPTTRFDRHDRHVRHGYVQLNQRSPLHRIQTILEDALRLTELPAENLGRVYFFRRVSLHGLPAEGVRAVWLERIQSALYELATKAVHASDWRAASADAVFFFSYREMLELQLQRLLSGRTRAAWFWETVETNEAESGQSLGIATVIEQLRQLPNSHNAVAQAIFNASPPLDIAALLAAIPVDRFRFWLDELGEEDRANPTAIAVLPATMRRILQQAISTCGPSDSRTLWLVALAVVVVSPASMSNRTAVFQAKAILRHMTEWQPSTRFDPHAIKYPHAPRDPIILHDDGISTHDRENQLSERFVPDETMPALTGVPSVSADQMFFGEASVKAGLYFLLNTLKYLGIATAIEKEPALGYRFVALILKRIAAKAGTDPGDPIMAWCNSVHSGGDAGSEEDLIRNVRCRREIWPSNLPLPIGNSIAVDRLSRLWSLAVRHWCWRTGRLTILNIVNRTGCVCLSRTDLDVFFPLKSVDVRIRRIGLDIDPGWLPWFGRVVRFHYTQSESGVPSC